MYVEKVEVRDAGADTCVLLVQVRYPMDADEKRIRSALAPAAEAWARERILSQ